MNPKTAMIALVAIATIICVGWYVGYSRLTAEHDEKERRADCGESLTQLGKIEMHEFCLKQGYITQAEFDRAPKY